MFKKDIFWFIVVIVIVWWGHSHSIEKEGNKKYYEGYYDAVDDAKVDTNFIHSIVDNDPELYCQDYANNYLNE